MISRPLNRLLGGVLVGLAVPAFALVAAMSASEYSAAKDQAKYRK